MPTPTTDSQVVDGFVPSFALDAGSGGTRVRIYSWPSGGADCRSRIASRAVAELGAVFPPGDAREDWAIIRAMSDVLGAGLDYVTLGDVRNALVEANDVFNRIDELSASDMGSVEAAGNMDSAPFESPISNYYMTDPISRASETMAACTDTFVKNGEKTGTDG